MPGTKKSICFISPDTIFKNIGGSEVQTYILASEAAQRGWNVFYVTKHDQVDYEQNGSIHFIPFEETGNIDRDKKTFMQLLGVIDADVYYQRGRKLWTYYTGEYSRKARKTFIFATSMDIDCYRNKKVFRYTKTYKDIVASAYHAGAAMKIDRYTLRGMKSASLVLSQTKKQKELLSRNLSIQSAIFPNIHSLPPDTLKKSNPPVVLWLANLKEWKQPEIFLEMARSLKDLDCQFILAGRIIDTEYKKDIEAAEKEVGNFRYIGNVSFDKSNDLIAGSSLFVNTSRMEEGFPNTYIQAWMRRTPTITLHFDPDGVIEREGLGAKADTFARLCDLVAEYVQNRSLRDTVGERARNYAEAAYGVKNNADNFFSMIRPKIKYL